MLYNLYLLNVLECLTREDIHDSHYTSMKTDIQLTSDNLIARYDPSQIWTLI